MRDLAALDQRMLYMKYAATLLLPQVYDLAWIAALPVVVNLLHRLLASFVKDTTHYNRFYKTRKLIYCGFDGRWVLPFSPQQDCSSIKGLLLPLVSWIKHCRICQ